MSKLISCLCCFGAFLSAPNLQAADPEEPAPALGAGTMDADPGGAAPDVEMQQFWNLLSPIVTTATKDGRHLEQAPSVITVVTRDDMRNWGYATLTEALQHVLGFYVVDDHVLPNIAVRGFSGGLAAQSSIVKILINGAPSSFRSTSGNWLDAQLMPISAVERIEILRGPASALYGADAFLGVINIITRAPEGDTADLWMGGNWRQSNQTVGYDGDASLNLHAGKLDTFLAVRLQAEDRSGLAIPPTSPAPTLPSFYSGGKSSTGVMPSRTGLLQLHYALSDATSLHATAYLSYMERTDEFAGLVQLANGSSTSGVPSRNLTALIQGLANGQLKSKLSSNLDMTVSATYFYGQPRGFSRLETGSDLYNVFRDLGFQGVDAYGELRWALTQSLTLTGGLNIIYDHEQLPSNVGIAKVGLPGSELGARLPDFSILQGTKDIYNPAAYLQALWEVDKRYLTIAAGLRYDYHTIYAGQWSPRLGLVSEPFSRLFVKALYGSAFKAPSPLLLYAVPAHQGDIIGNSALAPQRVHTFELELTRNFLDFLTVSSGVAYNLLLQQAEFTQTGAYELADNLALGQSVSWESRARVVKPDDIEAYLSLEYNYTVRSSNEIGYKGQLDGVNNFIYPPVQVHAGAIKWMPQWHLRGMIDATYVSPRNATDSNILSKGRLYTLPAYFDIGAGIALIDVLHLGGKAVELGVTARNLLNESAGDPGYLGMDYPRLPRSVFFYAHTVL